MEKNNEKNNEIKITSYEEIEKIYKYIKNGDTIMDLSEKFEISPAEVYGLIEMLKNYNKSITIQEIDGEYVIKKGKKYNTVSHRLLKPSLEELKHIKMGIVSDSHLCTKYQQLHMLNKAYKHFNDEEITDVYHIGDLVDGDYTSKRKNQAYDLFARGADEQADYVADMYPQVEGITTKFIQGSHDETHKLNGGICIGRLINYQRPDLIYAGQDWVDVNIEPKTVMRMRHPGGGTSQYLSRCPQKTIDAMGDNKPKLLLEGHYHKSYYFNRKNVPTILVPSTCYQSQFMERKDIGNIMGYYILELYIDEYGDIQYIKPREYLFDENKIKYDDYKKTRRLVIK